MAQPGKFILVRTNKDTDFVDALAQHAASYASLTPPGGLSAGKVTDCKLRAITISSVENLSWELMLFGTSAFADPDQNKTYFLGKYSFVNTDAVRIAGAGVYYYYKDSIDLPYEDIERKGKINVVLINRSAGAKTAGAGGAIVATLSFEYTQGGS
jgi:hypothetical protein